MFRLIRLNADFDHMTYVLAFDKEVVASVLTQEQGISGYEYLEKIVQVGFDIPPAELSKLKQLLAQALESLDFMTNLGEENLIRWVDFAAGGLDKLIRTPRDVVRYINGLAVNGGLVSDEVNPVDLAAIEAIRTFAPEFYSFIRNNRDIVIGPTGGTLMIRDQTTQEGHRRRLDEALSLVKPELQPAIREICSQLFPETEPLNDGPTFASGDYEGWRKERRICTVDFFPRYFYLRPSEQEVSQAEFVLIIGGAGNRDELVTRLDQMVDVGRIDNFLRRLGDAAAEVPEKDIESLVLALFEIGDKLSTGLRSDNQLLAVSSVIHKLLARLPESARQSTLLTAATSTSSLGTVVYFTRLFSEDSRGERQLIDEARWKEVINNLVTRIRAAAEGTTLISSPHFAILLYRWRDWAPIEESQKFVERLVESDDGVLDFVQGMLTPKSTTVGKYAARMGWYFPTEGVKGFIAPELLVKPLQRIKRERWADVTDLQREAINAFFESREPDSELL